MNQGTFATAAAAGNPAPLALFEFMAELFKHWRVQGFAGGWIAVADGLQPNTGAGGIRFKTAAGRAKQALVMSFNGLLPQSLQGFHAQLPGRKNGAGGDQYIGSSE